VLAVAVLLAGCGGDGGDSARASGLRADRFDVDRAWTLIERQLASGQRPAGSPQLRRLAERLRPLLPNGHFEPVPGSPGVRNVVGTLPGTRPGIVVGAHYDTLVKPRGFVGANNGAAGTAAVIEIARALRRLPRPAGAPEIRFVLFDGEEPAMGLPEESGDFYHQGLRGSRAYVGRYPQRTEAMILLDYIANKGLRLPREGTSTLTLWARLRAAARRVGALRAFPPESGDAILDDHTPFVRSRVPAIDLIDWSYRGHDLSDRLDKLSKRSLDAVGETVVELVRELRAGGG
jgi:glutaminyl-peptide cyclotransferase